MPELPEIALYKQYFDSTSLHQTIRKVEELDDGILQCSVRDLKQALEGAECTGSRRIGKYLFVKTSGDSVLVLHFGMTGKLEYYGDREVPEYSKVIFHFTNGYHLAYVCMRKLGKIYLTDSIESFRAEHELGRDAMDFEWEAFNKYLGSKRGSIKGALTDQSSISGIGNVYADEIVFQSRIHPKMKVKELTEDQRREIFDQMRDVLQAVIDCDAVRSELPPDYLTHRREAGTDCPRTGCDGAIEQIKVSGRSTYFCHECQK